MDKKFVDFLLEHRIAALGGLYRTNFPPRAIKYCVDKGQNFVLAGNIGPNYNPQYKPHGISPEEADKIVDNIKDYTEKLNKKGVSAEKWIYGFDERWVGDFPLLNYLFGRIWKEAGVPGMTTAYDASYGVSTNMKGVAAWVPRIDRYNYVQAEKARKQGIKVWWYLIFWELEQPAIRSRLLPWMTYKYDVDGLLHWAINRWTGNNVILSHKIKTDWKIKMLKGGVIPSSCGMLIYPGENGPISSIRFENLRDGIEEYDLFLTLKNKILEIYKNRERYKDIDINMLEKAVSINENFIRGVKNYTHNPKMIYEKRKELARAMEILSRYEQKIIKKGKLAVNRGGY